MFLFLPVKKDLTFHAVTGITEITMEITEITTEITMEIPEITIKGWGGGDVWCGGVGRCE